MRAFHRFVGIDWSGAEGRTQRGIRVAEFDPREGGPRIKPPPTENAWSRSDVLEYLEALEEPTLVGMDFGFSLPWPHEGALFNSAPEIMEVTSLWKYIELLCCEEKHFYAGAIWKSDSSKFREYIHHHATGYRGILYNRLHLRQCERECELQSSLRPISIYHMSGAQVGAGSFSGMRILNEIKRRDSVNIAIWPFDPISSQSVVIVEIYPSLFYVKKGFRRSFLNKRISDDQFFGYRDAVLRSYGAVAIESDRVRSVDSVDAMVSAAALASGSKELTNFDLPCNRKALMQREGWIFGVSIESGRKS
jgi:hypothetical protein